MTQEAQTGGFEQWAIVELFGHQRIAGRVSEQVIAGTGFVRVDVPPIDGRGEMTRLFGTSAVYSITPTTRELAERTARGLSPAPIRRYELPPAHPAPPDDERYLAAVEDRDDDEDEDPRPTICQDCGEDLDPVDGCPNGCGENDDA